MEFFYAVSVIVFVIAVISLMFYVIFRQAKKHADNNIMLNKQNNQHKPTQPTNRLKRR